MKRNVKIFCAALALVLVFGAVVGGTIAWLTDKTETVTNTFTVGKVDIELYEHQAVQDVNGNVTLDLEADVVKENSYKMIPGSTFAKDPTVKVVANSEACWLFVKVVENNNEFGEDSVINWGIADGWQQLVVNEQAVAGVWFRAVDATTANAGTTYSVLAGDKVTINGDLTSDYMEDVTAETQPNLVFTAYAVQAANIATAAAAWAEVPNV